MIEIKDKSLCSGCSACEQVCPKNCIKLIPDNEGFLYPSVNKEECINCGLCDKTCPILNPIEEKPFCQDGYIMQNLDEDLRKNSTSGGFFTAAAMYAINKGGVVFGAVYDKNFVVIHKSVQSVDELEQFRFSKYSQTVPGDCFKEAKKFLEEGRFVLFCGTPCHIEGLKAYLKKEYSNLLTLDFVCHAVPSPLTFKRYIEYQKERLGDFDKINFRDKSPFGYTYSMFSIKNKNKLLYKEGVDTDPMMRAFFTDICDRPSCYRCAFKKRYRVSDITMWDCFEPKRFDKSFDNKGTNRILVHTDKGRQCLEEIKSNFKYAVIDADELTYKVKEMFSPVNENPKRSDFMKDCANMNAGQLINKYFANNAKTRVEKTVRRTLSYLGIYSWAKDTAKRLLGR